MANNTTTVSSILRDHKAALAALPTASVEDRRRIEEHVALLNAEAQRVAFDLLAVVRWVRPEVDQAKIERDATRMLRRMGLGLDFLPDVAGDASGF